MESYVCEIIFRKDKKSGKIVWNGSELVHEAYIVQANSETFAKQTAWSKYAKEHGVPTSMISVGKVKKL